MNADPRVTEVRDAAGLDALAPAWWGLWRRSRTATPFQSPAWLLPWWRAFAPGELSVVAVHENERLIGLAPLYVESCGRTRRLLPIGISLSDYVDVLLDRDSEQAARVALMRWLAGRTTELGECELCELAPGASALTLPGSPECLAANEQASACPVLTIAKATVDLGEVVPARQMRKVRMAQHRAERRGGFEIVRADRESSLRMFDELARLHAARWTSQGEPGVLCDPHVLAFHRDAIPELARAGLLRLRSIRIGGETAGVYYGFAHGACAYAYLGGFDPRFAFESPGTLLIAGAIEEAIAEGACEFHFLRGREAYKYAWGAVDRWNATRVFRKVGDYARAS